MAGRVRGFETVGDMLRSLGVVGVFVAVVLIITLRQSPTRTTVDPAPITSAVAIAAPYAASVPGQTPSGWTVTSARVTAPTDRPYTWYIGYSTDAGAFVAVSQVYGDPVAYLRSIDAVGDPDGTVVIGGETWTKLANADGSRRALVRTKGQVTTVVVGTAPYSVLEASARALRPATKPLAQRSGVTTATATATTPTG